MWIHILLFAALFLGIIFQKAGRLPPEFMHFQKKKLFYIVLFAGNFLGGILTVQQNRDLQLGEDSYFLRPAYGEGYYEEQLEVTAEDGRSACGCTAGRTEEGAAAPGADETGLSGDGYEAYPVPGSGYVGAPGSPENGSGL